ncbi:MAG: hypothetical protein ACRDZ3_07135 [Acidimicrobiia bacterium]
MDLPGVLRAMDDDQLADLLSRRPDRAGCTRRSGRLDGSCARWWWGGQVTF